MPTVAQVIANQVRQLIEPIIAPNPQPPQGGKSWLIRQERIRREGSPYFNYALPVTAAAARREVVIETAFPEAKKYEPLNFLEVTNNGTIDLELNLKGDTFLIPAGVIKSFARKAIWQFTITNADAANPTVAGAVRVALRKLPKTIDDWAAENA